MRYTSRSIRIYLLAWAFILLQTVAHAQGTARPEIVLQTGHRSQIRAVAASPDGQWIVTGGFDSTIRIWDAVSGQELRAIGTRGGVSAIAISRDGKQIISAESDDRIYIWSVESGVEVSRSEPLPDRIDVLAIADAGDRIAVGGAGKRIWIMDRRAVSIIRTLDTQSAVRSLAYDRSGRSLASGGADGTLTLWDADTGKRLNRADEHASAVTALRFDDRSEQLVSGGEDGAIRLRRLPKWSSVKFSEPVGGRILDLAFPDADTILGATSTGQLVQWNTRTKKLISRRTAVIDHERLGEPWAGRFTPDRSALITGNGDGTAFVINSSTAQISLRLESYTTGSHGIAFSHNRRWLAVASFDNSIRVFDLQTGIAAPALTGHLGRVRSVVFHADTRRVISGSSDGTLRVWDTSGTIATDIRHGHSGTVGSVAAGDVGEIVLSGGADRTVRLWYTDNPARDRTVGEHKAEVVSVAISRDEKKAASVSSDGYLKIWSLPDGRELFELKPGKASLDAVAFSPDGRMLAVAGSDNTIWLIDSTSGTEKRALKGHDGQIYSLVFNEEGTRLISAGIDRNVRIWDSVKGHQLSVLRGHSDTIFGLSFLPGDERIASASGDGSINLWHPTIDQPLLTILTIRDSNDWLVATPEGFFDGSQAAWSRISWRFDNSTFASRPVEEFFSEFWMPGLLSELVAGAKLPGGVNIATKDRRQPVVKILVPELGLDRIATERLVKVRVQIQNAPAGARDVRLFRNGVLVNIWRGDVLGGGRSATLDFEMPITAGENRLTAYAFNTDDIKSRDDTIIVKGPPELARKGVLHILAIGINEYANPLFRLAYAVDDAEEFAEEFTARQRATGNYREIMVTIVTDKSATKSGILSSISRLKAMVEPEDSLVIFYAGHGAEWQESFYLIPTDITYSVGRVESDDDRIRQIVANGISDVELETAVEGIAAEQFLLVIDACRSGQVIEAKDSRRGPMNSKGLGQLAYEKGMYILTASQGTQDAKEYKELGNGYLTYALVEDGLRSFNADQRPQDGRIVVREWLEYAAQRVPQIDQAITDKRSLKNDDTSDFKARNLERAKVDRRVKFNPNEIQRPRLFYRSERDKREMVIATRGK